MKNKKLLLILGGCLRLILLCCCSFLVLGLVAPSFTESIVESTAKGPDSSYTRFENKSDIETTQKEFTQSIVSVALGTITSDDDNYTVELTEKQMLSVFFTDLPSLDEKYVDDIGIDVSEGEMAVQISMDMLTNYDEFKSENDQEEVSCGILEDLNIDIRTMNLHPIITFEIVNDQDLSVKDFSLGSELVDSWCKDDIDEYLNSAFDTQLQASGDDADGTKIEFKEDKVIMSFPNTSPSLNETSPAGSDAPLDTDFDLDEYLDSLEELQNLDK